MRGGKPRRSLLRLCGRGLMTEFIIGGQSRHVTFVEFFKMVVCILQELPPECDLSLFRGWSDQESAGFKHKWTYQCDHLVIRSVDKTQCFRCYLHGFSGFKARQSLCGAGPRCATSIGHCTNRKPAAVLTRWTNSMLAESYLERTEGTSYPATQVVSAPKVGFHPVARTHSRECVHTLSVF